MRLKQTLVILCAILLALLYSTAEAKPDLDSAEHTHDYITITDTLGNIILQTGLPVYTKDEFIDEDNRLYVITAVQGMSATAESVQEESSALELLDSVTVQAPQPLSSQLISIYHTHTDESYIPSDGKSTEKGNGSILQVGQALSNRLTELGYQTNHDKTLHDPHDANAYHRSRRTAMKLLQKKPAALFDIHRDSAPAQIYNFQIKGQAATKILLVVGRQNQFKNTTMNFAKTIKAAADAKYKGLIRGIFIAKGGYNQDLNPRSILVEIGTQYNSREAAERSAVLFADLVPSFLQRPTAPIAKAPLNKAPVNQPEPTQAAAEFNNEDSGWNYDLIIIAVTIIAGAALFLFLSTGSIQEAKNKLKNFTKHEFSDIFRHRKKQK